MKKYLAYYTSLKRCHLSDHTCLVIVEPPCACRLPQLFPFWKHLRLPAIHRMQKYFQMF